MAASDSIDHLDITTTRNWFLPEMDEGSIVLDYTSPPGHRWKKPIRYCVKQKNNCKCS